LKVVKNPVSEIGRRVALAACLALVAFAGGAQAQIYKCERDGKTAFSDRPCESGAKSTQGAYATSGATGALDLRLAINTYEVRGRDHDALARSLNANGPRGFHGLTTWKIDYEFTTKREQGGCRVETVRVTVGGQILMPRWADESAAPPELQRRWNDYYAALKLHEDGHIQNGRDLALLVKERLMGLGTIPCDGVNARAQSEFDRLYQNLKTRDQDYDARTNHGATQGAVF
jgi:predicted secreted Zn-dependent protease